MEPRIRYRRCRACGRSAAEAGPISARGLCADDAEARMRANTAQMRARRGPFFEGWYEAMRVRFEHRRLPPEA